MSEGDQITEHIAEISFEAWDGRSLGNGPLALVPMTGSKPGSNDFRLLGAHDNDQGFGVPFDRVGDFLLAQPEAVIVADNAAKLFWPIHDLLLARNEVQARQGLWNLARAGRIRDIELIRRFIASLRAQGQLSRHADGGSIPRPDDPCQIFATFFEQRQQMAKPRAVSFSDWS